MYIPTELLVKVLLSENFIPEPITRGNADRRQTDGRAMTYSEREREYINLYSPTSGSKEKKTYKHINK